MRYSLPQFSMHISRGVFLKTCGLALMAPVADNPVVRAAAGPAASPMAGGDVFLGQILTVPYNFAPVGFALCDGQLLQINQYPALFSLLGTFYGGNGTSTFALPNLQGRVPIGFGQGTGLTNRSLGEAAGSDTVTLTAGEMPAHLHTVNNALTATARAKNGSGTSASPVGNVPAIVDSGVPAIYGDGAADGSTQTGSLQVGGVATAASYGGGQAHNNLAPSLVVTYVISIAGIFPPRD